MISKNTFKQFVLITIVTFLVSSCGKTSEPPPLSIEGTVQFSDAKIGSDSPVFIAVSSTDDFEMIKNDPGSAFVTIVALDKNKKRYQINLTRSGLKAGDTISVFAFIDNNYAGNLPNPDPGDIVGFYTNNETMSASHILQPGENKEIDIDINREVFSFETEISGTISSDSKGEVVVFAYAGEITSLDFSTIDFNKIIGYKKFEKQSKELNYSLEILPYGYDLPIENVYAFVLFDKNDNGIPDEGDAIGYHTTGSGGMPSLITITENPSINIDMAQVITIPPTSKVSMTISGNIVMPGGFDGTLDTAYVIVAKTDNPEELLTSPMDTIKYFEKLDAGSSSFSIDLSGTDLNAGDNVMVIALWDKDYVSGFPNPTPGDVLGFYINAQAMGTSYTVQEGTNENIDIHVNREMFSFDKEISGTIQGSYTGDLLVFAYAGEINSLDFSNLDFDQVIGYQNYTKTEENLNYQLTIFPFGQNLPIDNVYVFVMFDVNGNGLPDAGDSIGYYSETPDRMPTLITIINEVQGNVDIQPVMEITEPSADSIFVRGALELPNTYDPTSGALYMIVAKTDNPEELLTSPMDTIKYFEKLDGGSSGYSIDLSGTDLVAGDNVMVISLWDKDYVNGFPNPTPGDELGFYINAQAMGTSYTLQAGVNDNIDIHVNREMFSFDKEISGSIQGEYIGDVLVFAYAGEINSLDFSNLDFDQVIGYKNYAKTQEILNYQLTIFPFGQDLPIDHVYVFAMFDVNRNGLPDAGDLLGYYSETPDRMPTLITISSDVQDFLDIQPVMEITEPSADSIFVSGALELPNAYDPTSGALYMIVANADNPEDLLSSPVDTIKYFEKLDAGSSDYSIDLSGIDLVTGDEVMVIALWDKDYVNGFPNPTPGDVLGFYINSQAMGTSYTLQEGINENIDIHVNREMFSFDKEISGSILCNYTGDVLIFAYAGEINSLDFSNLDFNQVIGFQTFNKTGENLNYNLTIFPFGHDLPISDVYVIALFDNNQNGKPDPGDLIGYYSENAKNFPTLITINHEIQDEIFIEPAMEIPEPSGFDVSISGRFDIGVSESYHPGSSPVFMIVAKTENPEEIFNNPVSVIKAFQKLEPGATNFSMNLSSTDLLPGDRVMVTALWDMDFSGGFPNPTPDDYVGYYQNKENFLTSVSLTEGDNLITPSPAEGWYFSINRKIFDHNASLEFTLENGGGINLQQGDRVILAIVQKTGVNNEYMITDMDYVVAMTTLTATGNPDDTYSINLPDAQLEEIVNDPFGIDDVYVYAIRDINANGKPDYGEPIGFYWNWLFAYYPKLTVIHDGLNVLDKTVRFTNTTF